MNEVPPIHDVPPILPPSYRDRRTSLILFGILEILLGALCLLMAGVAFWIGWSWYRLKVEGWWALVAVLVVMSISNGLTFARVDFTEVYQRLGYPQAQIDLLKQQGWMTSGFMMWSAVIWELPMLGYLLWVKRFFRAPR